MSLDIDTDTDAKCAHCGRRRKYDDLRFLSGNYRVCRDNPATEWHGISECVRYAARNDLDENGKPQGMENRG